MPLHVFKVPEGQAGERLDVYLTASLPEGPSRSFVKKLIDHNRVTLNGQVVKAHYRVAAGDEVSADIVEASPRAVLRPEDIALDIFYEDPFLIVVHKPVGMLVHPTHETGSGTLVNALLFHCSSLSDVNEPDRPGIVHRLDRETSGLLVAAKDNRTHIRLARQFEQHRVRKQYLALVEGSLSFEEGKVDVPLGRHPRHFDKRDVSFSDDAREAVTLYRVVKRFDEKACLVALFPQSGRTHQLRVHMAHLGHPILGDAKYGKKTSFGRMALHAKSLGFVHPQTNGFLEFSCPPPKEFLQPSW